METVYLVVRNPRYKNSECEIIFIELKRLYKDIITLMAVERKPRYRKAFFNYSSVQYDNCVPKVPRYRWFCTVNFDCRIYSILYLILYFKFYVISFFVTVSKFYLLI